MPGLDYDNSAASFFGLTMLGLYLLPACYYIQRRIRRFNASQKAPKASDSARSEEERKQLLNWEALNADVLWTPRFKLFVATTAVAGVVFFILALMVRNAPTVLAKYDPYAILGISTAASDREIKSAYRKLSLQHHPDKGGDVDKFQSISKAYEALTDPVSAENYRLYGNPDGKQPMEISIGLPTALQSGFTGYLFLLAYISVLVIVIPTIMCNMYRRSKGIDKSTGFKLNSMAWLGARIERTPATVSLRTMPEIIAGCPEFQSLFDDSARIAAGGPTGNAQAVKQTETVFTERVKAVISSQVGWRGLTPLDFNQLRFSWLYDVDTIQRNALLLLKYALRRNPAIQELINVENEKGGPCAISMYHSQLTMLTKTPKMIETMIDFCVQCEAVSERNHIVSRLKGAKGPQIPPIFRYLGTIKEICRFSGLLVQGLWEKDNDVSQAVTNPRVMEEMYSSKHKGRKPSSIRALLDIDPSERPIINDAAFPEPVRKEVGRVIDSLPDVWIFPHLVVADVEDDDCVREGDVVTATFTIVHANALSAEARARLDAFRRGEVDLLPVPKPDNSDTSSTTAAAQAGGAAAADGGVTLSTNSSGSSASGAPVLSTAEASTAYGSPYHRAHAATLRSILTPAETTRPVPHVYAPHFPVPRGEEQWHVFFTADKPTMPDGSALQLAPQTSHKSKIVYHKRIPAATAVETVTVLFQAPLAAGTHPYTFHAVSVDYVGLDVAADVTLHVAPKLRLPASIASGEERGEGENGEGEEEEEDKDMSVETMMGRFFGGRTARHGHDDDSDLEDEPEQTNTTSDSREAGGEDEEGEAAAGGAAATSSAEAGAAKKSAPSKAASAAAAQAGGASDDEEDEGYGTILAGAGKGAGKKARAKGDKKGKR